MTTVIKRSSQDTQDKATGILNDLYQNIDDTFVCFFISQAAPKVWRPHLEKYEAGFRMTLQRDGYTSEEIERKIEEECHMFSDDEFTIQTTTKNLRKILIPGNFENFQAKKVIQTIYDDWESIYRNELEEILGVSVQGDIWGDLRLIRHSISHRGSIGVEELKNTKLIKDFKPNQEVIFTSTIMENIREELENWYTKFLMKHFSPQSKL